jgi:hypothetical protein
VAHSPAETKIFLGSPSLALLANGKLVAAHDYFGPNSPKDCFDRENTTKIYYSDDIGKTWSPLATVLNAFWSSLFVHRDVLYLLGCSAHYGDIVIRSSSDGGKTWTKPRDEYSGLLFRGGQGYHPPNYHCAPVPIVEYRGRLWRAFEDNISGHWPTGFHAFVLSTDVNSNLLHSSSWLMTNKLSYDRETDPPLFSNTAGWLEGNVVSTPHEGIWNILRVNSIPVANKAAITKISRDGQNLDFNPADGFIDFPGGMAKFTIRYDKKTKRYVTLTNEVYNPSNPWQRNILSLISSQNLLQWKRHCILLHSYEEEQLVKTQCKIGFQYVDWLLYDDDLLFLSRTAYQGAVNYHDSNYITFHRLTNFRERLI